MFTPIVPQTEQKSNRSVFIDTQAVRACLVPTFRETDADPFEPATATEIPCWECGDLFEPRGVGYWETHCGPCAREKSAQEDRRAAYLHRRPWEMTETWPLLRDEAEDSEFGCDRYAEF